MRYRVEFLSDDANLSRSFDVEAGDTHEAELRGWEFLMESEGDNWGAFGLHDAFVVDALMDEVSAAYAMLDAASDGQFSMRVA